MNSKMLVMAIGSLGVVLLLLLSLWKPWEEEEGKSGARLQIYCASGLRKAVDEIVADYKKEYGVKVVVDSGPSGVIRSRVIKSNGSIGDLFLPADKHYVDEVEALGLIAEEFAVGNFEPVIAVEKGNPKNIKILNDLLRDDVSLGLGNPQASIGRTAKKILASLGVWEQIKESSQLSPPKITFMGNVTEVALHVKKKVVDAGIVWKATAVHNDLDYVEIEDFSKNKAPLVLAVLKKTKKPTAAIQFARYLTSRNKGLLKFKKHSFQIIEDGDVWVEKPRIPLMYGSMLVPGLRKALDEFKIREGVEFDEVANSCSILVAQMKNGKIPEAYVACHDTFMDDVQKYFDSRVIISKNFLVIVVPKGNPHNVKTLQDLTQPNLRIGLGHHLNSVMGDLTKHMLEKFNVYEKIVMGGKMREFDSGHALVNAFLLPKSAALDAIIVYRSNVLSNPKNSEKCEVIDLQLAEAMVSQSYAINKMGGHRHLMQRLFQTVTSHKNKERFLDAGFTWSFKEN